MSTTMAPDQKSFDPAAAKDAMRQQSAPAQREQRVYDERVFMQVERFQLSRDGGEHWAIGHSVTNPDQKVMVRLSTVDERMKDLPQANEAKLRQSYESGEFRRETLVEKAQSKIKLIAFDGARPLGENADGVKQYRAHWPQTMAAKPEAEVTAGVGTIVLYQPKEGSANNRADAYVEFLRTATQVDGSNVQQAMESALTPEDDQGHARDSHALVRVFYQGEEVATARVFPARAERVVTDPVYGDERKVMVPVDAASSFESLQQRQTTGIQTMDGNNDLARAVIAGLMDADECPEPNVMGKAQVENFFNGVKNGDLEVEVVSVERIKFGMDSAKTYLKDRENIKFANYQVKTEVEGQRPTFERGYGNTVVAFQRYPNGQPFAVYASPQENVPRVSPLAHFDSQMPLTSILPEDPKAPKQDRSNDNSMSM